MLKAYQAVALEAGVEGASMLPNSLPDVCFPQSRYTVPWESRGENRIESQGMTFSVKLAAWVVATQAGMRALQPKAQNRKGHLLFGKKAVSGVV